ncbi:sensor histidine kinase [Enterococcus sp. AZ178]|uniref:sensor histidine kinase n=1 Tax=Enterococcus sp. AZ178 TaxID=2774822 RepID=UPI003F684175
MFQQFYKSNNSEGHGLGLTIVNQILSVSNCEILVESKEGLGTDFIVEFPLNEISYE